MRLMKALDNTKILPTINRSTVFKLFYENRIVQVYYSSTAKFKKKNLQRQFDCSVIVFFTIKANLPTTFYVFSQTLPLKDCPLVMIWSKDEIASPVPIIQWCTEQVRYKLTFGIPIPYPERPNSSPAVVSEQSIEDS